VKQETKRGLFASTVLAGLALTMPALAQEPVQTTPAPAPESSSDEDVVVVTGSRLVRQDFTAISPVTTVGSQDIELTATLSVEQLLNELPQVIPGNTVTSNNAGGEDFATIDLRGLGPSRTLVLIDGERVPAASTTGVVDLNTIPAGLIDRIEVVTGGASAVYGSDAIAGVVNFILKDDYEGAEIRSTISSAEDGNGQSQNVDFLLGGNFANGKGNITTYGSWFNREGVKQSAYDYSRVSGALVYGYDYGTSSYTGVQLVDSLEEYLAARTALGFGTAGRTAGTFAGGGSATPPWGSISSNAANPFTGLSTNPATAGRFAGANTDCNPATAGVNVNGGNLSFNDQGQLTPSFTAQGCAVPIRANGSSRYNFAPDNFIYLPAERFGIQTFANYEVTDSIDLKMMLSYVRSIAEVSLAPTPVTGLSIPVAGIISGNDGILGNSDDPHADLSAALLSRTPTTAGLAAGLNNRSNFTYAWRSNALGPRTGEFQNSSLLTRASLTGELPGDWEWVLNLGWGQVDFSSKLNNNVNTVALLQGVAGCQAVQPGVDGLLGTADDVRTPRTRLPGPDNILGNADDQFTGPNLLPGCTQVDIFGPNALSAAAANFIRTNLQTTSKIEQSSISGYVRGDLFELPAGPVSAVFGLEYRDDEGNFIVDDAQRRGEIAGFNAQQSIFGNIDVWEAYGEFSVPLLSEVAFAHSLSVEAGYRVSDYSTVGSVESYKYGLEYSPVSWLTARTVFNRAVRAPSLLENFQAGDQGFPSFVDPCRSAATAANAPLRAFCIATGVPAGIAPTFAAANSQVQAFSFGNGQLESEEAETFTAGVVFQPDWLPIGDLKLSVDYYDIKLDKAIVSRGAQTILNSCYGTLGATPQGAVDCANVSRDPATGQILFVNTSLVNATGEINTKGVDISGEFGMDLDELFGSAPGRINIDILASLIDSYNFLGTEIVGTTEAGIGAATPDFKTVTTVQYEVGDFLFQARHTYVPGLKQDYPGGTFGGLNVPDTPEFSNLDVSARWDITDTFRLVGVVENVFDEFPPQTVTGFFDQANTDAALYAPWVTGRNFSISARLKF
jgi:iron complex outermembrane recepter protein